MKMKATGSKSNGGGQQMEGKSFKRRKGKKENPVGVLDLEVVESKFPDATREEEARRGRRKWWKEAAVAVVPRFSRKRRSWIRRTRASR
jgi:hypothetical protein